MNQYVMLTITKEMDSLMCFHQIVLDKYTSFLPE